LGGLRSAETGLERQACVTETGRRARSGRLAGLGLEIQHARHQARIWAVAAPAVDYSLDHGLLSLDRSPKDPKGTNGLISALNSQ